MMNHEEFTKICHALGAPSRGWQKALVEHAVARGFSITQPTISQIYNDPERNITTKVETIMRKLSDEVVSGNIRPGFHGSPSAQAFQAPSDPDDGLTNEQITDEINEQFELFDETVEAVVCGNRKSTIISSPPGFGKSHIVFKYEEKANGYYQFLTGDISSVNVYKELYKTKDNGVLVFDDIDVFSDEVKLNLLKGALDIKPKGRQNKVCWMKESNALAEEDIPRSFDFQGRVLFMTNVDFDKMVSKNNRLSPHIAALLDRSGYLTLGLHTVRRRLLRVKWTCANTTIMSDNGVESDEMRQDIMNFIEENQDKWRNLNCRLIVNLCKYATDMPSRWQKHAKLLMFNNGR